MHAETLRKKLCFEHIREQNPVDMSNPRGINSRKGPNTCGET